MRRGHCGRQSHRCLIQASDRENVCLLKSDFYPTDEMSTLLPRLISWDKHIGIPNYLASRKNDYDDSNLV